MGSNGNPVWEDSKEGGPRVVFWGSALMHGLWGKGSQKRKRVGGLKCQGKESYWKEETTRCFIRRRQELGRELRLDQEEGLDLKVFRERWK